LGKVAEHFAAAQLLAHDNLPVGIYPVHLKAALGDVESDPFYLPEAVPLLRL
jgi:hypothetical protein